MTYNMNQIVSYSDDFGYRQSIRDVFGMNCDFNPDSVDGDCDAVTKDELMYEADAISKGLDDIYERTKDVPEFHKIYSICAGFMLSVDPNIGLAVVTSTIRMSEETSRITRRRRITRGMVWGRRRPRARRSPITRVTLSRNFSESEPRI
jgi:hypothetical protein